MKHLALRYLPHFFADEKEPFPIGLVGWHVLPQSGPSPSFNRKIILPPKAVRAIEYAVYFDFDIEHLYDLEHVWVYLGKNDELVDAESSAHGGVINCMRLAEPPGEESRLRLYLQPGKHAILPRGDLAMLFPGYADACDRLAGSGGVLVPEMFREVISVPPGADEAVEAYIQKRYRFMPTLRYLPAPCAQSAVVNMEELFFEIPRRVNALLREICSLK